MLIYFDRNGVLKEYLDDYGNPPRVGTTEFKIVAYFEGLEDFEIATIRLRRPDLEGSEYPDLFMIKNTQFEYDSEIEQSVYFKQANNPYTVFEFDFNQVRNGPDAEEAVRLLDAPGMWQATITVYGSAIADSANVTGIINFNVEEAVSGYDYEDDFEPLGAAAIINNVRQFLESLVNGRYVPYTGAAHDVDLGTHELISRAVTVTGDDEVGQTIVFNPDEFFVQEKDPPYRTGRYSFPLDEGFGNFILATREWVSHNIDELLQYATFEDIGSMFN